ncbi:MAG: hypothetical protein Q4F95_07350 [Oscillospiraceae bacterium]|nr:hypothetical protein [Oscillospiraceae bacterium]
MKQKEIDCLFCNSKAVITYEENRVYRCSCEACMNVLDHRDDSWDEAVKFYEDLSYMMKGKAI